MVFIRLVTGALNVNGIWCWPTEEKQQDRIIRNIAASSSMLAVLVTLSKNKNGLSNAEIDIEISNFSQWNTLWTLRQLLALGFVEYKTEFFGNSGKYVLTELGIRIAQKLTEQRS
jgi:hypothetical protein